MALGAGQDWVWGGGRQQPSRSRNPLATTGAYMEQATMLPFVPAQRAKIVKDRIALAGKGDTQASLQGGRICMTLSRSNLAIPLKVTGVLIL